MSIEEFWIRWGALVVLGTIVLMISSHHLIKKRGKRMVKQEVVGFDETLFGSSPTTLLENLEQQKKNAETQLNIVKEEGKEIVLREQELDLYYHKDKQEIKSKKNELGLKFTTWKKQLQMYTQMIDDQKRMQEELR